MSDQTLVVFVHGWSVTNNDTYGGLPLRLRGEAEERGIAVRIKEIFLGRYISFHDEVRLSDISRAFQTAIDDTLSDAMNDGTRFVCITHSTGGPVIRDWWHRYYKNAPQSGVCPMSHLIMLAPANYGSALAQLGKGRLSRLKSWFKGVDPGQGVLDWLELGSEESWNLNMDWILSDGSQIGADGFFPFVLTGQSIDRAFYDNLNTYTGEMGSDGVVRVASANLRGTYIKLVQEAPTPDPKIPGEFIAQKLAIEEYKQAPVSALRIISGTSHSGEDMGIMQSVKEDRGDEDSLKTVRPILECIKVRTGDQYRAIIKKFFNDTKKVQDDERLEVDNKFFRSETQFFHDRCSMVVFRMHDDWDHPVIDYDLILIAGPDGNPNHLPKGFFIDRQRNRRNPEAITYFFNYDVMKGCGAVPDKNDKDKIVREALPGADMLGIRIVPRPDNGFVHYLPCEIKSTKKLLELAMQPNSTTLIDIRLQRIVRKNVFRLNPIIAPIGPEFKDTKPGEEIVG